MRKTLAIASGAAALALATAAFAYGENDGTYRGSAIANSFCGTLSLLGDQGLFLTMNGDRLARLRAEGTLDTGFGSGGFAPLPTGLSSLYVDTTSVNRLGDGGFLVIGSLAAAKLRAEGSLDTGYGTGGRSDTYGAQYGTSTALQPDGAVIAAVVQGLPYVAFTRVGPDGRIDPAFGVAGVTRVPSTGAGLYAWGVQHDGAIQWATMQIQPDGTPRAQLHRHPVDFTAADNAEGRLMPRDVAASWTMPGARVDGQGRLIIATNDSADFTITRFDAQGRPDATFGVGGTVVLTPRLGGFVVSASLLNLEPDGAITVVVKRETFIIHGGRLFAQYVFRFTESGAADPAFPNGLQISDTPAFAMDDAGRLLVTVLGSSGCATKRLVGDHARSDATLVEYRYRDRYFVTAEGPESSILDTDPASEKLVRTGRTFGAWLPAAQVPGSLPACRFNGDAVAGPVGHFYSLQGAECELVRADDLQLPRGTRAWRFEGFAFNEAPASASGSCPPSLQPVYRIYNDAVRRGGDPNHRFTTDAAVIAEMQAKGWVLEGVAFCAPPATR